jgi:hypothetical protein
MAITATAPRGGIVEEIDGVTYTLLLRCREIERFEGYCQRKLLETGRVTLGTVRINRLARQRSGN